MKFKSLVFSFFSNNDFVVLVSGLDDTANNDTVLGVLTTELEAHEKDVTVQLIVPSFHIGLRG